MTPTQLDTTARDLCRRHAASGFTPEFVDGEIARRYIDRVVAREWETWREVAREALEGGL